ncbi:unnamed protein product [Larinioides sclopetarius]|uniref:Uncharacterized protein n=1 Tax=Larinioides sclopetarius TaxID=280406 RepID=A0AAV2BGY5_9ARAC
MGDSETGPLSSSLTGGVSALNDAPRNMDSSLPEDVLVDCVNGHALDKIYEVAVRHVTELAESHLKEDKQRFISRFSEVFKNVIQENVTVNGLPWIINEEKLTPDEKQEQTQETTDALLSKLSKTVEKVASKRRSVPKNCVLFYKKQEKYHLKKTKIVPDIKLPSVSGLPRPSELAQPNQSKELLSIYKNMELAQQQIAEQAEKLSTIQKRVEFANNVARQHEAHSETLYDTGYLSE